MSARPAGGKPITIDQLREGFQRLLQAKDAKTLLEAKHADEVIVVAFHGDTYSIASWGRDRARCEAAKTLSDRFEDALRREYQCGSRSARFPACGHGSDHVRRELT